MPNPISLQELLKDLFAHLERGFPRPVPINKADEHRTWVESLEAKIDAISSHPQSQKSGVINVITAGLVNGGKPNLLTITLLRESRQFIKLTSDVGEAELAALEELCKISQDPMDNPLNADNQNIIPHLPWVHPMPREMTAHMLVVASLRALTVLEAYGPAVFPNAGKMRTDLLSLGFEMERLASKTVRNSLEEAKGRSSSI